MAQARVPELERLLRLAQQAELRAMVAAQSVLPAT
jgi:hypothetical protein